MMQFKQAQPTQQNGIRTNMANFNLVLELVQLDIMLRVAQRYLIYIRGHKRPTANLDAK